MKIIIEIDSTDRILNAITNIRLIVVYRYSKIYYYERLVWQSQTVDMGQKCRS